jgi:hypothetical protein
MSDGSAVSGGLSNMSMWVTFKDKDDVTRIMLRSRCKRDPYCKWSILVDDELNDGLLEVIFTKHPYDEIFGS